MTSETHGRPASPTTGRATFADAFRGALRSRGLTLERVCDHLATKGINVSPATLSHWQRGRSLPERAQSLRALRELENILGQQPGALTSLLVAQRPRGRTPHTLQDVRASRRLYGADSPIEQLLGDAFERFNADLHALFLHETVDIDARRRLSKVHVTQIVRAVREGADRLTVAHVIGQTVPPTLRVSGGRLGEVRFDGDMRCLIAEIHFGRVLASNETALIDYTVFGDAQVAVDDHYERGTRINLREYLLHVRFRPEALPVRCYRSYRENFHTAVRETRPVALDASHSVHLLPGKCPVGVHGLLWEWPDLPPEG
ncbi:helix-turn-helix transcriptional regulator [Streptomyces chumphonensis]|uniref:Helix-turn-helix transcriptional regulator n=1 Tax=Streptomyces chumphonensis TaxID=1214925 RepID=A0A927EV43_9ACTN|nr:helix-turn-helix transcriptional regulator [Streptomyces chumphonensis]MBD3930339.1 helix-turn-helix transcriptional regulator [Streptomyces chumphonensis]